MPTELPELVAKDFVAWRAWLEGNHAEHAGVFLVLAKKGTLDPTTLRYDEALEEALCFGWIDGQVSRRDESTYRQRFTPRRPRSSWSRRNVDIVTRLESEGRMRPAGLAAVRAAQENGRWEAAYHGMAAIEVPDDLREALRREPAAAAAFEELNAQNRYAILYRIGEARRPDTRERRIAGFVEMLSEGRTPYPQAPAARSRPRKG